MRDGTTLRNRAGDLLVDSWQPTVARAVADATLAAVELTGLYTPFESFVGCVAPFAQLSGAFMIGCDFRRADFRNADFTGANLTGCDFRESDLTGAVFDGANLVGCNFEGAVARGASFPAAQPTGLTGLFPRAI